ncbi:MAG: serine hydrolase [Flammeovirgaceae bacterium]
MRLLITFFLAIVMYPSIAQNLYFPPQVGNWETVNPESLNWCESQLDDLENYLDEVDSKAFLILKDGKIVVEWYFDDFTKDSLWYWASAGKSMMATLVGIAQQEGLLDIQDKTADYLGQGWTNCPTTESAITIWHQLTMTSGLDDAASFDCTLPNCLVCKTTPGDRWAYHNGPYSLLREVVESATGVGINTYFTNKIGNVIGAGGGYVRSSFNNLFLSRARDMARFGLMTLAKGTWNGVSVITDTTYYHNMIQSSQDINPAYGYLWWLNGKNSYKQPRLQVDFSGPIIPSAPADLYAAMGKNEQRIYIVPSESLVVVRMGNNANDSSALALSGFDQELWEKMMNLECTVTDLEDESENLTVQLFPNPSKQLLHITSNEPIQQIEVFDVFGQRVRSIQGNVSTLNVGLLANGVYFVKVQTINQHLKRIRFLKE